MRGCTNQGGQGTAPTLRRSHRAGLVLGVGCDWGSGHLRCTGLPGIDRSAPRSVDSPGKMRRRCMQVACTVGQHTLRRHDMTHRRRMDLRRRTELVVCRCRSVVLRRSLCLEHMRRCTGQTPRRAQSDIELGRGMGLGRRSLVCRRLRRKQSPQRTLRCARRCSRGMSRRLCRSVDLERSLRRPDSCRCSGKYRAARCILDREGRLVG